MTHSKNGRPAPTPPPPTPPEPVAGAAQPASSPEQGLGRYIATLRRQWLLVAVVVISCATCGFVVASARARSYEATAQILLDRQDPVNALLGASVQSTDPERDLNTSVQLVGLESIASRVARNIGSTEDPKALLTRVRVAADGNSDIVSITARDRDARRAARIANAFASEYSLFRTGSSRAGVEAALGAAEQRLRDLGPNALDSSFGRRLANEVQRLRILAAFQTGGVQVVRRAVAPSAPSGIGPGKAAVIAAFLGMLLAGGLVVLIARTDHRLHDEEHVERAVGLPVLASVPRSAGGLLGTIRADRGSSTETTDDAYLTLGARLGYGRVGAAPRVILLTSPDDDASASAVALGLAGAFRTLSRAAVAIEADLRTPRWAAELGLKPSRGLSSVLLGKSTFESARLVLPAAGRRTPARARGSGKAWVIPAGPPVAHPEALLAGDTMAALVEDAWGCHDFVLVAAPPMTHEGAALAVSALCDGALLVLRRGATTEEAARHARRSLDDVGMPLLGAVFTAGPPLSAGIGPLTRGVRPRVPVEPPRRRFSRAPNPQAAQAARS